MEVGTVLLWIAAWILLGLSAVWWLARNGHRDPYWYLFGVVLGPILWPVAWERIERRPRRLTTASTGPVPPGTLKVLVAVDGSKEAVRAYTDALEILGPRAGRLILVEVVDYDAAEVDWRGRVDEAEMRLGELKTDCRREGVDCIVLAGRPAETLLRFAAEEQADLIVVGKRGSGMSTRLLGSVTSELLRESSVPLMIGGAVRSD